MPAVAPAETPAGTPAPQPQEPAPLLSRVAWRRADGGESAHHQAQGLAVVLVAADSDAEDGGVTAALRRAGMRVRVFETDTAAAIDPAALGDKPPRLLVNALGATVADAEALTWSLFTTVQAVLARGWSRDCQLSVVSRRAVDVSGGGDVIPARASVAGLVLTLRHEHPELRPRLVDIGQGSRLRVVATELLDGDAPVVAVRGADTWVPGREPLAAAGPRQPLRRGGLYLITGGLRGLGLLAAQTIAANCVDATLILVSKSGRPRRPADLDALRELGATACAYAADVADPEALRAVFADVTEKFGPVNGVVHAAGIAGGGLAARRTRDEVAAVLAPKVAGTENLLTCLRNCRQLDFLVLYSSRAAWRGLLGSADYAAANAYLDAIAVSGRLDTDVLAIQWPSWTQTGMAASSRAPRTPAARSPTKTPSGCAAPLARMTGM